MSNPSDWGPPLWRVLHSLAERLGKQKIQLLIADENRAWVQFLKSIEFVIPCAKCRAHYKSWRIRNPLENASHLTGEMSKIAARKWLWGLHCEINQERGVANPTLDEVKELYADKPLPIIREDIKICNKYFNDALLTRIITPEVIHTFKKTLAVLLRFI